MPEPTDKNVVKAIRKLAKDADSIVIATDYDREGELIGLEALQQVLEVNPGVAADASDGDDAGAVLAARPPIKRARYSALTKDEIERAFQARRARLRPRLRGRGAPGHRPDLGRHPHPARYRLRPAASAPTSSPSAASRARPWR